MLRTLRRYSRPALALLAATALGFEVVSANGADSSFEPQSTLDAQIAPHDLSIDAAIASMVRRGLLADVAPSSQPQPAPTRTRPVPGSTGPRLTAPVVAPRTAVPQAPQASGWRPQGTSSLPLGVGASSDIRSTLPALSTPMAPAPSAPVLAPPTARATISAPEAAAEPTLQFPDLPTEDELSSELTNGAPAPRLAERTDAEFAEPPTSDDPLPEDSLEPIDALPETPAPANDAPGDPREPEIGDEDLEGSLAPPANSAPGSAPAPGSLSGRSLTPVGEPDRIEEADESISPPSNPEMYQEPEEAPRVKPRPLTRNQVALRNKVRNVLKYYYNNPLNTADRSPWEVMHCMLSFEVHSRILKGGPEGEPITTVGWLCFNQPCKGRTLMYLNQDGNLRVKVGPALQGHHGQLLALLAQARVRTDYPMRVEGKDFTVADLIEEEKATCYPRTELTFKLLGLQRYLDINATWMNDQGMQWDFPTLLREEMRQPVRTAACGGTHRLSGLALTVKKRQRSGLPVDGEYAAAQKFVANYVNYAYRLQNKDGSFSTEWFKGPGAEEDIDRRLKTTGHQLEFLIYQSPDEQLGNQRLVRGVNYLSNIMWANRGRDWEAGPLGHAIHALVLYDRLVFAPHDQDPGAPSEVAQKPRAPQQRQSARRARR